MINPVATDVCIVGAGMVGATLALALAGSNQRVVLLEARKLDSSATTDDVRNTALGFGSRQLLEQLGVWRQLENDIAEIHSVHVSQKGSFGVTRLNRETEKLPALGYLAPNHKILTALYQLIAENSQIELIDDIGDVVLDQQKRHVNIAFAQEGEDKSIQARLLLAADGTNSSIRSQCNIATEVTDYEQSALIANVSASKFNYGVAYERFTKDGPVALLPLANQEYSMVWTMRPEVAAEVMALEKKQFLERLQKHFGYRVGLFESYTRKQVYPLRLLRSHTVYQGRCLLIGNAAYTIHPVAGQGFNLALRDLSYLAALLKDVADPGLEIYLDQYQQDRKSDVDRIVNFTDGLLRTFANDSRVLAHARGAVLTVLGQSSFLQRQVSRQGLGLFQHDQNVSQPHMQEVIGE